MGFGEEFVDDGDVESFSTVGEGMAVSCSGGY